MTSLSNDGDEEKENHIRQHMSCRQRHMIKTRLQTVILDRLTGLRSVQLGAFQTDLPPEGWCAFP
jgi:hypothetical protein